MTVSESECLCGLQTGRKKKEPTFAKREREREEEGRVLCVVLRCVNWVSPIVHCKLEPFFLLNSRDQRMFGVLEEFFARSVLSR